MNTTDIKRPKMAIATLLLSAFMASADTMVLQPIIDLLATDVFPDAGYAKCSMIMSASAITLALVSIASGFLARFGKKRLLLAGSLLFAFGGLAGATCSSINLMIFTRIFEGLGVGLVVTVSLMLIPTLLKDQNEVDRAMGINGILMALFGAVITFTAGYLALANWKLPFAYYALGLVIFVFQIVFIPSDDTSGDSDLELKSHFNSAGLLHALSGVCFGIITSFFFVCLSGVIAENGIGDAAIAGTAATCNTIGSFISGFVFAIIFEKLRNYSFPCFYLIMAAAMVIFINASSSPILFLCAFMNGFGYNWYYSAYVAKVSMISDEHSLDKNMSIATGGFYIGQFITPMTLALIANITGNTSTVFAMKVDIVLLIIFAVIHFIAAVIEGRKPKQLV